MGIDNVHYSLCVSLNKEIFNVEVLGECQAISKALKLSGKSMGEANAPVEANNPSTLGVFDQATCRGHTRATTSKSVSVEFKGTRRGRGPTHVDHCIFCRRILSKEDVESIKAEGFNFFEDELDHKRLPFHDKFVLS